MEKLSRNLNGEVQRLVTEGQVSSRSAQEIARLPSEVQLAFAISVSNDFLNKENVTYLVNRYLNKDAGPQERERIINAPKLALPDELKCHSRMGKDNSVSARLCLAIARCLDSNAYLYKILGSIDIGEAAIRMTDVRALSDSLAALHARLAALFPPGENGDANDWP